jgi:hypothetical protein
MSGIASAAIMGGMALAGSVGSGLIAKAGASGGAATAGGGGQEAYLANQAQIQRSTGASSPYRALGANAVSQIGALLGYGSSTWNGPNGLEFQNDPNAQANAIDQTRAFANGSGATDPTYMPTTFNHSNVVSDNFTADPSYAWRVSEGNKALDRSAASRGMLLSGAQAKGLTDYNSNVASQEYGNWYNRLDNQNKYNLQGDLTTNAQNFGQQQQIYGNQQGRWNNALSFLSGNAALGSGAVTSLNNANTGASTGGGSNLTSSGIAAGNNEVQGGNALASGIGAGVNNAIGAYYLGGGFGGGSSSFPATSIGGMPRNYYTSGGGYTSYGGA